MLIVTTPIEPVRIGPEQPAATLLQVTQVQTQAATHRASATDMSLMKFAKLGKPYLANLPGFQLRASRQNGGVVGGDGNEDPLASPWAITSRKARLNIRIWG